MLRVQITSEVANCEGCVVVGSNCRSPDCQEKVVIPLDRPGPPVHWQSGLRVKFASVTKTTFKTVAISFPSGHANKPSLYQTRVKKIKTVNVGSYLTYISTSTPCEVQTFLWKKTTIRVVANVSAQLGGEIEHGLPAWFDGSDQTVDCPVYSIKPCGVACVYILQKF